ncbi:FKBP-type peptidyl-prolyl cis-trans isomerase [Pseudonocardia xinjiangensis]|uniref:FKBP-type peptidyl-prolyl cis-trans isomerase n=1 Tax=Pseudonocardia xinjiangensis TaxID=75289 RepID=UPI003D90A8FC
MNRSLLRVAVATVAVTALAGCGSGAAPAAPPLPPAAAPSAAPAAPAPAPAPGVPALTGNPTDLTAQSEAQAGTGQPPTKLVTQDIVVGTGKKAVPTDTVDVQYSGTLYSDGKPFDSSWKDGGQPVSFPLDGVVPGFAQGIEGMQVGGRRVIVIPPDLGYGNRANGSIPAGSTLVFVVDLVGIS